MTSLQLDDGISHGLEEVDVAWAKTGNFILVTTFGSGSCPRTVLSVQLTGPASITLVPNNPYMGTGTAPRTCTGDLRPYSVVIEPPPGIGPNKAVTIAYGLNPPIDLPPRS